MIRLWYLPSLALPLVPFGAGGQTRRPDRPTTSSQAAVSAADTAFRAGSAAFERGDLRTAHAEFARVVRLAPAIAAGHSAFGAVLLAEGEAKAAVGQLEEARRLDPNSKDGHTAVNLAEAYAAVGDHRRAVATFRMATEGGGAVQLTPEESLHYAAALAATGQTGAAETLLAEAARTTPDNAYLADALGSVRAQAGRLDDAATDFRRALGLDANFAPAHFHLGAVALLQGDAATAVEQSRFAVDLVPADAAYVLQLGRALSADRKDTEAVATLRRALALDPVSIDAKYALALALQAGGDAKGAAPLLAEVIARRPRDSAALTNFGLALVQGGDAKGAIPVYQRALQVGPDNATLREDFGVAYLQQADLDHAIEQFRAGLKNDSANAQLHYDLGLAWKLKDDLSAAVPELTEAERLDPTLPDPPYTLGVLLMQTGRFAEAQRELERATELRPDNGEAWSILGNVYKQAGDPERAVAALRKAIALLPDQPSPHITMATLLAQAGDSGGAAAERKKAADLSRAAVNHQRSGFALDSGRALLGQGKVADAEVQLRAAIAAEPGLLEAHRLLAEALTREGKGAEAALERRRAEAPAPGTAAGVQSQP